MSYRNGRYVCRQRLKVMHGRRVAVQDEVDHEIENPQGEAEATAQATQKHILLGQAFGHGLEPFLEPRTRDNVVAAVCVVVVVVVVVVAGTDHIAHNPAEDVGTEEVVAAVVVVSVVVAPVVAVVA